MLKFSRNAHWRDSAREAKFFFVDAKAAFPLILFLVNIAWWTLILAVVSIIFFAAIEKFGFNLPVFWRFVKSFIAGPKKMARPWWKR